MRKSLKKNGSVEEYNKEVDLYENRESINTLYTHFFFFFYFGVYQNLQTNDFFPMPRENTATIPGYRCDPSKLEKS